MTPNKAPCPGNYAPVTSDKTQAAIDPDLFHTLTELSRIGISSLITDPGRIDHDDISKKTRLQTSPAIQPKTRS